MPYSKTVHDAVHDALLTLYGYIPALTSFDMFQIAKDRGLGHLGEKLFEYPKSLDFKDGLTWGTFVLPKGTPFNNLSSWEEESFDFLSNPDGYINELSSSIKAKGNWKTVNIDNNAGAVMSSLQIEFVTELNICQEYDKIWPQIDANYRTMSLSDPTPNTKIFDRYKKAMAGGKKIDLPRPSWAVHLRRVEKEIRKRNKNG